MDPIRGFKLLLFLCLFLGALPSLQAHEIDEQVEVSLRMVGHQVLLSTGDSTSRVLPIEPVVNLERTLPVEDDKYRIRFESEFSIEPSQLVLTVTEALRQSELALGYVMQVQECESGEVVYSFQAGDLYSPDITPCGGRALPRGCYSLVFTLLGVDEHLRPPDLAQPTIADKQDGVESATPKYVVGVLLLLGLIGLFLLALKRRRTDPNLIVLGNYKFDTINTELLIQRDRIELSGKEADLLKLLHSEVNTTIKREELLNKVWGDEGDYVGRTLDVFISKLRKKLEADPKVKIVNIRGVGYKLVVAG